MNPIFSVGIYVIWQLIVMALIGWCIEPRKLVRRSKKRRGALCFAAIVYIVLSLLPVMGAFIPDSPVKFRLQAAGNIWLGFVIYVNNFLLILCLILDQPQDRKRDPSSHSAGHQSGRWSDPAGLRNEARAGYRCYGI